ncbi:MAG: hypothetical protein WC136_03615 [Sphaerochaeta sp.]|jgi:hypothetical protein
MNYTELLDFSDSVTHVDKTSITLSYNFNDYDDMSDFQTKVNKLYSNFFNFNIMFESQYQRIKEKFNAFKYSLTIMIIISNDCQLDDIKSFIVDIDSI